MKHRWLSYQFFILLFGALLFIPFLDRVHLFDWDEINFAESAREMIATGDYLRVQINYQPFWEKPPLFIWLQALMMHIFGIGEFAARLPNALTGMVTLLVLFHAGKTWYNVRFGLLWMIAYAGSLLPHFYFKSGIIDPIFNLFIFLSIFFLALNHREPLPDDRKKWRNMLLAGLFAGLAVLTKGPVGFLMIFLTTTIFYLLPPRKPAFRIVHVLMFFVLMGLVSSFWYGLETMRNGFWFLQEFLVYQVRLMRTEDAGHGGPIFYHFMVLLLGCFPASIFIFRSFKKVDGETASRNDFRRWMVIMLMVVLVIFSLVKTKIIHYSSLAYFPLTFLAAHYIYHLWQGAVRWRWFNTFFLFLIGFSLALAITLLPIAALRTDLWLHLMNDPFAAANLQANVTWRYADSLIGLIFLAFIIISYIMMQRGDRFSGAITLFIGTILMMQLTLYLFVPRIERYSQGAAIDFYKSLQNEDVYVDVVGYKSYAHLFYSRKPPEASLSPLYLNWLDQKRQSKGHPSHWPDAQLFSRLQTQWYLDGEINKPAYFVSKINHADQYRQLPQLEEMYEKNGFVFFRRNVE